MNSEKKVSKLQDEYIATSNSLSEVQTTFNDEKKQIEILQKKLDQSLGNCSLLQKEKLVEVYNDKVTLSKSL